MNVLKIIEYLRGKATLLKMAFFLFLGALVLLDILLPREDAHYFVDKIYAFWTFFALAGCFLLIKISKGIAHFFLSKDEDYYG
ncbi:MAG: hypothetical protein A2V87_06300 [Deltaproteobacteria bacterium RBG_16_58_17]|nr:MAG: hypothetical protein A2V87_06300 [Deltaproteobacteria bacterium RBG_16_58_17]OHE18037.1 MAG: hypothetical protein A2X96_00655 [Syntrophobacterales bacterium GWC2_56_13]OHE21426.1 MAG: hypothetical protein A2X95_02070 [Syntrophobacterales bacterium GWF2_56_9]